MPAGRGRAKVARIIVCVALTVGVAVAAACGSDSEDHLGPGNCTSEVDSVKQVATGTITAYVANKDPSASYLLSLGGTIYTGNNLQDSPYVLFTGLPSGTFTASWTASGCDGDQGEDGIPGPSQVTVE